MRKKMNALEGIELTIKRAVLETALRHLFARPATNAQRVTRNMIEFGCSLCNATLSSQEQALLYHKLLPLVQTKQRAQAFHLLLNCFHL